MPPFISGMVSFSRFLEFLICPPCPIMRLHTHSAFLVVSFPHFLVSFPLCMFMVVQAEVLVLSSRIASLCTDDSPYVTLAGTDGESKDDFLLSSSWTQSPDEGMMRGTRMCRRRNQMCSLLEAQQAQLLSYQEELSLCYAS